MIDNGGNGHHAIPPYLKSLGVETLILGNRGQAAQMKVTHTLTAKVYGISGSWTMSGEITYKKRNAIWVRVR